MASAYLRDEGSGLGASVIHANSASASIVVPDAHLLFSAHFSRSGPDLVLTGTDGRHYLIPGYFSSEHPPALAAPNGATLSADVIGLMAGSPTPGEYAQTQPTTPPDLIGKVEKLVGDASVVRNGVAVTLHVGDAVYKSDVIETGADSKVGIGFPDGTALELLANTRMALSEYSYDPNGHANSALFTYVEGTFGFFAGKVAHTGDMKIATPVATMGIRGTTGVMGQGTDGNGHDFYWQAIYDDPHTNVSGSWDDFGQNSDGTTFVELTVSQPGEMTVFTLQGPGLPPLITTIPIPDSYNLIGLQIIEDLWDIIQLLNVTPHSLGVPDSPENPQEILPPDNLPGLGNGPQPIFYIPLLPPGGGPPVVIPILGPPTPTPGTQTGFIWPSGTGTWDTAFGWIGDEVPISSIDTVTIESGIVQYGSSGGDNYVVNSLIIDSPGQLDITSGSLNIQNGLNDGGILLVEDPPSFGPTLTVSGPVTIAAGAKLIARGDGALVDLIVATVENFGTIAARHGGEVEFIDDSVTNAAAGAGSAPGKIKSVGFGSVVDFTGVNFNNGGVVLAKDCGGIFFVDASVTNEAGGKFTANDFGSLTFSSTPVDNSGVIRAIFGGFIKFEDLVTNETGGDIRSAGCNSCVVFCGDELDNSGIVSALRGGNIKFFGATIVNEAAGTTDDTTVPGGTIEAEHWGSVRVYGGTVTNGAGALVEARDHGTIEIKDAYVLNVGKFRAADCGLICIQGCDGSVTNTGEFVARDFGTIVFDRLSGVTNEDGGRIEARDHGRVVFADVTVTNYDQTEGGPFHHAGGGVIAAIGCGSQVDLADATIAGGRIETRDGGVIETVYGCNTFLNVTLDGAVVKVDCGTSLALDGGASGTAAVIDGCVTLEGGGVVTMAYESYRIVAGHDGGTLVNDTTISGLGQIGQGDGALIFVNCGTVDAHALGPGHGDAFIIDTGTGVCGEATTFNTGTLEACGPCAELLIEDTTLDNCGGVIAAIGWGATVDLDLSFIAGGDLETRFGGLIQTVDGNSTFDAVTIDHGSEIRVNDGTSLTLVGTIRNHGTIDVDGGSGAELIIDGAVTLDGKGTVTLDGKHDKIVGDSPGSTLDNVNDTIAGFGKIGGDHLTFDNGQNGTVDADVVGKTLVLDTGNNIVRNTGDLESTNGGILKIKSGVDNAGGIIGAFGAGSLTELIGVTIKGGTLQTGDPYWLDDGVIAIVAAGCAATSIFDGLSHTVQIAGFVQVDPGAQLELKGNIDNNGGTVDVDQGIVHGNPAGSDLLIDGVVTLSGDGAVALEGNSTGIVAASGGGTLDNESYIYGSRGGFIGTGDDSLIFNNSGTVNSEAGEAGPLVINTGDNVVTNTGTLEATAGSELDLYGTIDNAGGNIAALFEGITSSLTVVKLFGATIEGGTLTTDSLTSGSDSMIEVTAGATSTLDGFTEGKLTVDGYVQVDDGADLALMGTIDNLGTIDVDGTSGADLVIDGTVKLKDDGDVILDDHKDQIVSGSDSATLDNFSNISGQGTIGDDSLTLINETTSVIDADGAKPLVLNTGTNVIENKGTFEATNGATLDVQSDVNNSSTGLLEADITGSGSTLKFEAVTVSHGEILVDAGNTLEIENGETVFSHVDVENSGHLKVDDGDVTATLLVDNGTTLSGIVDVGSTGELDVDGASLGGATINDSGDVNFDGPVTLTGDLTINLENGGTFEDTGTITVAAGDSVALDGVNVGTVDIASNATLTLDDADADIVDFIGTDGTLKLDTPANAPGLIEGLTVGDTIKLAGITVTNAVINGAGTTLTVTEANHSTLTYDIAGTSLDDDHFAINVTTNPNTGNPISALTLTAIPAPTFSSPATANVNEGVAANTVVYTAAAADTINLPITYALIGTDASDFTINSTTGVVTINSVPSFETNPSYMFTVQANDAPDVSATQNVTLAINGLPPVISSGATANVNEGVPANSTVYTAVAAEPGGGAVTYSLVPGGNASDFTISASTGVVTINGVPSFETDPSYDFTVKASNAAGQFNTEAVTLSINDLPPVFNSGATASVNEGVPANSTVYTAVAAEPGGGAVTYSLVPGGNASDFTISASTGVVTINSVPSFETKQSYDFTVKASNAAGQNNTEAVTLSINDLPPVISSGDTASVNADAPANSIVYTAVAAEPGGGTVTYSLVPGGDASDFTISSSTGVVTINSVPNFETNPSYDFTVKASNAAGQFNTEAVTVTPPPPSLITLVDFNYSDGASPQAGLIADAKGDLFGTTESGGTNFDGTVFEVVNNGTVSDPSYASTPILLANFSGASGDPGQPVAGLFADANGDLFGTTEYGGIGVGQYGGGGLGTLFEIVNNGTPSAPSYASSPTAFDLVGYFTNPQDGLIAGVDGLLLGTASGGGTGNNGAVFYVDESFTSAGEQIAFNGSNGSYPVGGLVADANGNLFGTTAGGFGTGADPFGSVFEIPYVGGLYNYALSPTTLVNFNFSDGETPEASLIVDAKGDLFGTTLGGGASNGGTVFEIVNNGTVAAPSYASSPTTLVNFGEDAQPIAGLIADANGDLFGTTRSGGTNFDGTVFEIVNNGTVAHPSYASSPTTLVTFDSNSSDNSISGLIADANGDLFGTTDAGGTNDYGTVFEIVNSGYVVPDPATIANGASFEIAAASEDAITFAGNTGLLQLDQSQGFVGTVAGFGGQDQIDLRDIAFGATTTLSFTENNGDTLGVLTVSDGTHTADITLLGQYTGFTAASDGNGGTLIVDPPAGQPATIAAGALLEVTAADNATVTFTAGTGALQLDNPASFTGHIDGFTGTAPDAQHSDVIDLVGINYNSAQFAESYNSATGVLTVTDGAGSASLAFDNFSGTFKFASDGNGGTDIFDPPATGSGSSVSIGSSNDQFVFHPGMGAETIASFNPQHDTIELDHFAHAQTVQELQSLIKTDLHGSAVIDLGHHDSITLPGMTATDLHAVLQTAVHLH